MNKTNFKLFTMFLAGIAFSAMTVLAATISISTNFEDGVTQYLKKLVILKNDNTTWMVLDWDTLSGEDIYGTNITWTNIHWSSIYGNTLSGTNIYWTNISWNNIHWSSIHGNTLSGNNIKSANITGTNIYWTNISGNNITWTNIKGNKISGQSWLFFQYCDQSWQSCKTITQLSPNWIKNNNNNIYYNDGNVWIWTANPSEKLEVNGTGKFSGNITAKNGYFSGVISAQSWYFKNIKIGATWQGVIEINQNWQINNWTNNNMSYTVIGTKSHLFYVWNDPKMHINQLWMSLTWILNVQGNIHGSAITVVNDVTAWWLMLWIKEGNDDCDFKDDVWKLALKENDNKIMLVICSYASANLSCSTNSPNRKSFGVAYKCIEQ